MIVSEILIDWIVLINVHIVCSFPKSNNLTVIWYNSWSSKAKSIIINCLFLYEWTWLFLIQYAACCQKYWIKPFTISCDINNTNTATLTFRFCKIDCIRIFTVDIDIVIVITNNYNWVIIGYVYTIDATSWLS